LTLRFIKEEPILADNLRKINLGILPYELRTWALDWVEDVGRTLRARETLVGIVSQGILYVGFITLISLFPTLREHLSKKTVVGRFLEGIGVRG
jgi:hypothetical protein